MYLSARAFGRTMKVGLGLGLIAIMATGVRAQSLTAIEVMSNLDNPYGLAIGPDGTLYVSEGGVGGSGTTVVGATGPQSYGSTGALTRLRNGVQTRVVTDLPSLAPTGGAEAAGLSDIAFRNGSLYGLIGFIGDPALRAGISETTDFGKLVRFDLTNGTYTAVADISQVESDLNPNGADPVDDINSNPYGLLATSDGFLIADAGGNSLIRATETAPGTDTFNLAVQGIFGSKPNPTPVGPPFAQAVPTAVAADGSGNLFVSQLTGFPFNPGTADIFTLAAGGGVIGVLPTPDGPYSYLTDLVFSNGSLYALQYATSFALGAGWQGPGLLWRIDPTTGDRTLLYSGLTNPTGLLVTDDGRIFVTDRGGTPGIGRVLELTAAPEPGAFGLLTLGLAAVGILRRKRRA
ncbi:MAG: ScyD/ScyE family protein [Capsulimonadales bacterium]|nr:ScyD/ScyE family protein [Capsulimonadales bacterium]